MSLRLPSAVTEPSWDALDADACRRLAMELTRWNHPEIRMLDPKGRDCIADCLARAVRGASGERILGQQATNWVETLRDDGRVRLGQLLKVQHCNEVEAYFKALPCFNLHYEGHIRGDGVGRRVDGEASQFHFGSYPREDILRAPHLLDALVSDTVLDVVEGYLGAPPMMFSANVFWSFPGHGAASYGQDFHRDISHTKFCVLFLYLTDSDSESGAHQYILRTHRVDSVEAHLRETGAKVSAADLFHKPTDGLGFTPEYEQLFSSLIETIQGPAGTGFIEDTYGLHRGLPPCAKPRLAAWARYSVFPTVPDLERSPQEVVGNMQRLSNRQQYVLRAIVK